MCWSLSKTRCGVPVGVHRPSHKYLFLAVSIAVQLNLRECLVAYCILVNTAWETFACGDIKVTYNTAFARHDTRAPTLLQINFVFFIQDSLSHTLCLRLYFADIIDTV